MQGGDPMAALREVAAVVTIPIAVAGGLNSETAPLVIAAGASIAIIGGAIIKAPDAKAASETIIAAIASGESVATDLFKRGGVEQLREMFMRTTTANISDAMHHKGWLPGLHGLVRGMKCVGPAVTVWAYPATGASPWRRLTTLSRGACW
ncbi:MAG: bifunctional hexulose-6-phosphate synthase/ribonuclease regulator, partial [Armatimonadota bacterium]